MKAEGYIADLGKQAADILRDAEKPWALEAIATSHVYIPFQTFDAFVAACQYTGTTKQIQDSVRKRLKILLDMFKDVHAAWHGLRTATGGCLRALERAADPVKQEGQLLKPESVLQDAAVWGAPRAIVVRELCGPTLHFVDRHSACGGCC